MGITLTDRGKVRFGEDTESKGWVAAAIAPQIIRNQCSSVANYCSEVGFREGAENQLAAAGGAPGKDSRSSPYFR